ncbi:hypothetical protein QO058_30195 (plasmid) [Bosea vestrisii]|uniref:hypothetical protein n=1 Tax=Bosea vestrisii TaxID=151416 RepID=UPI0024DFD3D6|nr:hypothetical protein [Bosea vestrisii]WID99674.1 hypothetical protein QO058_30195 [Bosea vestrisii]
MQYANAWLRGICLLLIFVSWPREAFSQTSDPQRRRDELAKVREQINDPDPTMRLSLFEALVGERDTLKLQIAIQTALSGNDTTLRGAAFRAYLQGVGRFIADLALEPNIQQQLEKARQHDARELSRVTHAFNGLARMMSATSMRAEFNITEFDFKSSRGKLRINWFYGGKTDANFQVNGDRLITVVGIDHASSGLSCPLELVSTRNLTIEGFFVCSGTSYGRVRITAPMY